MKARTKMTVDQIAEKAKISRAKVREILELAGQPAPVIKRPSELAAAVKDSMERIGAERDHLRALIEDATCVLDTCETAFDDLNRGLDTLSQYV